MSSIVGCIIIVIVILLLLSNPAEGEGYSDVSEAPNQYIKQCGACMPLEDDPTMMTKQCVIRETTHGYPLLYYTMEEKCGECKYVGNNKMVCDTPAGKQTHKVGMSFC